MKADKGTSLSRLAIFRRAARLLVVVVIAIGAFAAWRWREALDPIGVTATLARHPALPLGFVVVHVAASLLFVPRSLLAIVAGMLFGVGWGIVWAELGGLAGAAAGFLAGRFINAGLIDPQRSARVGPILDQVERGGWRAVALLRLMPPIPHGIANYGLALSRLSLGAYTFGTLVGQLPMTIAYVEIGAGGERWLVDSNGWIKPTLIGVGALSFSLLIPAYTRWRAR